MWSIAQALGDILAENPFLLFGLSKRLFNLSQLSRELKAQVEYRTKKHVTPAAILMALSRLQRTLHRRTIPPAAVPLRHLAIQTGLSVYTFPKTREVQAGVRVLVVALERSGRSLTISEGAQEITLLLETAESGRVRACIAQRPKHHRDGLAALGMTFAEEPYLTTPGVVYFVLQHLFLQGINLIEMSSTYTGLTLFVEEGDAQPAFEAFYRLLKN